MTDWMRKLYVEECVIMVVRLIVLIVCCLFCNLLLLPVQNDSHCTENCNQPCCYWKLLRGYDFLLCNTARQGGGLSCHFDVAVISF